jgi:hypothetical protein
MNVHIEELMVRITPPERRTVISMLRPVNHGIFNDRLLNGIPLLVYATSRYDLNSYNHWLLRVTSRSTGKQWAIYLTGAQYDLPLPIFEWDFMQKHLINEILAVKPFGALEAYATAMTSGSNAKGTEGLMIGVQAGAMHTFHGIVDMRMEVKGLTWSSVLSKNEVDYQRHRDKVLRVGMKAMQEYVCYELLTKRRIKAERYDKRHSEELKAEEKEIVRMTLGSGVTELPSVDHITEVPLALLEQLEARNGGEPITI